MRASYVYSEGNTLKNTKVKEWKETRMTTSISSEASKKVIRTRRL